MVFSSLPFLFLFLTVVLLVSHLLPFKFRNFFLLLANLVFYAYGEPVYVLIMIASILVNFFAGVLMDKQPTQSRRRAVLVVGIVLNLAALGVFKYAGLFVDTLRGIPAFSSLPEVNIALPIGISFYTFQAVSYLIDVYWDDCEASHNFVNFACYISLFPQLIAGPIVRYRDVNEQLVSRHETPTLFNSGVRLFMVGMAKKVLLANQFGMLWESVSADPVAAGAIGPGGACAYTLQIYFDFAATPHGPGLGRMLALNSASTSLPLHLQERHRVLAAVAHLPVHLVPGLCVHPLGGQPLRKIRQCVNILVVWALTGFWHGAGWNFLFWGFYYGILLLIEKLVLGKYIRRLPAPVQHLYTMVIVVIGWVFFASPDLSTALDYLQVMFSFTPGTVGTASLVMPWLGMGILGVLASTPLAKTLWEKVQDKKWMPLAEGALCLAGLLLCTASLVSDSYNPFLYFRF